MLDPRTLAGRLAIAYAAALVFGLVAFAIAAVAVLDVVQRTTLDAQLRTASDAVLSIVDTKRGYAELDPEDRRQFARIVGTELSGAVIARDGSILAAEASSVPTAVQRFALRAGANARVATVADAAGGVRVVSEPIIARGALVGAVTIWRAAAPIVALDARVAIAFAVCIPLLALLAVFAGGVIAQRGLRPLATMSIAASEIEATDLSRRMDPGSAPGEVRTFVIAFNRMLDRLQAAFERQKRFTADASHELRTPLSVIRAEAELALMRERSVAEYQRALRVIGKEADEVEALTRDLLAMARTEPFVPLDVDLGAVASATAERLRYLAASRGATIVTDLVAVEVRADAGDLARLIALLVDNALKYGRPAGTVRIATSAGASEATLTVWDDGPGFSPDAIRYGFQRFWRGHDENSAGAGLGLSIARTIVDALGGTIILGNRPEGGAFVVVTLPLVRVPAGECRA